MVLLSVNNLDGQREASKKWFPLMLYKKAHEVSGELLVECFVSAYRPCQAISKSERSSPMHSRSGSQEDFFNTPKKLRFSFNRRTPSLSQIHSSSSAARASDRSGVTSMSSAIAVPMSPGGSRQTEPEVELVKSVRNRSTTDGIATSSSMSFQSHGIASPNNSLLMSSSGRSSPSGETSLRPQVTGVSPREGPVEGGQRVVLRGSNLGESKEDVVKVLIADVDCTSSLEFASPCMLPPSFQLFKFNRHLNFKFKF